MTKNNPEDNWEYKFHPYQLIVWAYKALLALLLILFVWTVAVGKPDFAYLAYFTFGVLGAYGAQKVRR
jgi:hypothetical protein